MLARRMRRSRTSTGKGLPRWRYLLNLALPASLLARRFAVAALSAPAPRQVSRRLGGQASRAACRAAIGNGRCIWLHAVSVGEVNLLAPLIAALGAAASRLGMRHLDDHANRLSSWPEDATPRAPSSTARSISPGPSAGRMRAHAARPAGAGRTGTVAQPDPRRPGSTARRSPSSTAGSSDKSFRGYRRIGWLVRQALAQIDLVAAQNEEYAERFLALGARPQRVHVTGSIKFDGARTDRNNPDTQRSRALAGIEPDDIVFLAGSTQEPEESLALDDFRAARRRASPAAADPRAPPSRAVRRSRRRCSNRSGVRWQRRSTLESRPGRSGGRASCWSTPSASSAPGGGRRRSPSSAAAWASAAART